MNHFRDYLVSLKADVDAKNGVSYDLVTDVVANHNVTGFGGTMKTLILESLGYVLDVAVNQGTVEDLRELEDVIDNSDSNGPQPSTDEIGPLLGELYNFSFKPETFADSGEPLDDALAAWINDVERAVISALLAYVGKNYEEPEDDDTDA